MPARPEEILAFAQRRTAPVISKNIDSNLAKKMRAFRLSDEDYLITLFIAMADVFYNKNKSNDRVYDSLHFITLLNTIVNLTLRLKTTNKC